MNDFDRLILRQLAALLRYPDESFPARPFGEEEEDVLDFLPPASSAVLRAFARQVKTPGEGGLSGVDRLRRDHVRTFDLDPGCSLYLAWHRCGGGPESGRALAGLNALYRDTGFELEPGEVPDYLPRLLEFLALSPDRAAAAALDGFGRALGMVAANVASRHADSAYAPLLALMAKILELPPPGAEASEGGPIRPELRLRIVCAPPRMGLECVRMLALNAAPMRERLEARRCPALPR